MPACAKSICIQEIPILSSSLLDTQQASAKKAQAPDAGKQRRRDGRSADESRPFFMKTGLLSEATGSAYVESGKIKLSVGVFGPKQAARKEGYQEQAKLYCDFKFCANQQAVSKTTSMQSLRRREKEISLLIQQALYPAVRLQQYPKSTIDIVIQVLEWDGLWSTIAASISACSLAIADAGIEMVDLISASAMALVRGEDGTWMDPTSSEELSHQTDGIVLFAYLPSFDEIAHVSYQQPHIDTDEQSDRLNDGKPVRSNLPVLMDHLEKAVDGCHQIHALQTQCLSESVQSEWRRFNRAQSGATSAKRLKMDS